MTKMIKQRPTVEEWLELPQSQRSILVLRFDINRSTGTQVRNNRLVSDGVSDKDLETGVNIGKMIGFLGEPLWKKYIEVPLDQLADTLWKACVAKEFGAPEPFAVTEEVKKVEKTATIKDKKGTARSGVKSLDLDEPLPVREEGSSISV